MTSRSTSKKNFYLGFAFGAAVVIVLMMVSDLALAQSDQYKRKESGGDKVAAPVNPSAPGKPGEAAPAQPNSDKVDVTDLEKKYWAPKDTDFSVVQNRTYTKQGKVAVSLLGGPVINDSYSTGNVYGLAVNYFMSERAGVQLEYNKYDLQDNKATKTFDDLYGTRPDHNKNSTYYGLSYNFIPVYAKASVLGFRIIYFDLAISPGLGMTQYNQQSIDGNKEKSALTYSLDLTQYVFLSQYFAVRVDIKNRWHKADVLNYRVPTDTRRDEMEHNTIFLLGATFYF
jgi:outer membrane beta-barrel protein